MPFPQVGGWGATLIMKSIRQIILGGLGLLILLALVLSNYLIFRYMGSNYFSLYFRYGSYICLGLTLLTLFADLDKNRDLISLNPFRYVTASWWLVGVPLYALGSDIKNTPEVAPAEPLATNVWDQALQLARSLASLIDLFVNGAFALLFILLALVWFLIAVPLQYFVFIICGAPARALSKSKRRVIYKINETGMRLRDLPANEPVPHGAMEATYNIKPVRLTSAIAALALWVLWRVFG